MLMLIFVLGRPRPIMHGTAFTLGLLGSHFAGGLWFARRGAEGLAEALAPLAPFVPYMLGGIGALFLVMGLMMRGVPEEPRPVPFLRDHSSAGWFLIGILLTMTKLPIAVAYGAAITQVVAAAPNEPWVIAGLTYYNVMAFLPVFLIWGVFFSWQSASQAYLGEINHFIRDNAARIMKWALVIVGAVLLGGFVLRYV